MLTVKIPNSVYYECTTYLAHNGQYPNVEYYATRFDDHWEFSFRSKESYLAFCYYWSKVIL